MQNRTKVFGIGITVLLLGVLVASQQNQVLGQQGATPQHGISYARYNAGEYQRADSDQTVEELANTGAEWINIVVTQYQYDLNTTDIYPTGNTPTDEDLIHVINEAQSVGLKVMLKPHIDIQSNPREWRGRIGRDFSEQQWSDWFASYRNFMGHYADLATEQGVDQLILGTELVSTVQREGQWREVIAHVRGRFSGPLTYSANHSGEETSINWWDALDYIGVSGYYDLTDKTNPSISELKVAWQPHVATLQDLHNRWNKPILFTEVGYRSSDGNNRHPWCYWCDEAVDLQEQADGYRAYLEVFYDQPWFAGAYFWGWHISPFRSGPCDAGYSPYDKPAENIMRQYFGSASRTLPTSCSGDPTPTPTLTPTLPPPPPTPVSSDALINIATSPITIDGSAESVWQSGNGYEINKPILGNEVSAADFKANYRALYDAEYLYLFVDVKDDQLHNDSGDEWWEDDVIEIYIDGNYSRGSSYDGIDDYQLFFRWNDSQVHVGSAPSGSLTGVEFVMLTTGSGYLAEIALPLSEFGILPTEGYLFGLELEVIDDDGGGSRETKYAWNATSDNAWNNPSFFGTARLFGEGTSVPTATYTPTPTSIPSTATPAPVEPTPLPPTPAPSNTSLPGNLVQEAENGVRSGLFVIGNDSNASGGAYVHVPDGTANRGTKLDPEQTVRFSFNVTTAGLYRVKGWVYAPDTFNNSFYIQVDGMPEGGITWHNQVSSGFTAQYVTPNNSVDIWEIMMEAGTHIINVGLREDGTRLDKIALELVDVTQPPAPSQTPTPMPTPTSTPGQGVGPTLTPTPTPLLPPTPTPSVSDECAGLEVEAEAGELSGLFVAGADPAASGGTFIHVPDGTGNRGTELDVAQNVRYCFIVTDPGLYRIKAWVHASSVFNNSFYIQVDGTPLQGYLWHTQVNDGFDPQYVSSGATYLDLNLTAGEHTVEFFLREDGIKLDRIALEQVDQQSIIGTTEDDTIARRNWLFGTITVRNLRIDWESSTVAPLLHSQVILRDAATGGLGYQQMTTIDAVGGYYFDDIPEGAYQMELLLPSGYNTIDTNPKQVMLEGDSIVEETFEIDGTIERGGVDRAIFLPLIQALVP